MKTYELRREFGTITINIGRKWNVPHVHLEMYDWSPSIYKQCKIIWKDILKFLKEEGYPRIVTCIPEGDDKLYKFQTKFGMKELKRNEGLILFVQEI